MRKLITLSIAALLMGCTQEQLDVFYSPPEKKSEMAKKRIVIDAAKTLRDADYFMSNHDLANDAEKIDSMTIDCSKITISSIRNVLGEDTYELTELCNSPNINEWALFKPYDLNQVGAFCLYNHEAMPPTYFSTTEVNEAVDVGASIAVAVTLEIGEMAPTNALGGFHNYKNIDGENLLGIGLDVDGTPGTNDIVEYELANFPMTIGTNYVNILSAINSTIKAFYYTRNSVVSSWDKANEIEQGEVSVSITILPFPYDFSTSSFSPSTHELPSGEDFEDVTITWTFTIENNRSNTVAKTLYWSDTQVFGATVNSGTLSVSVPGNSSIQRTITSPGTRYRGKEYVIILAVEGYSPGDGVSVGVSPTLTILP